MPREAGSKKTVKSISLNNRNQWEEEVFLSPAPTPAPRASLVRQVSFPDRPEQVQGSRAQTGARAHAQTPARKQPPRQRSGASICCRLGLAVCCLLLGLACSAAGYFYYSFFLVSDPNATVEQSACEPPLDETWFYRTAAYLFKAERQPIPEDVGYKVLGEDDNEKYSVKMYYIKKSDYNYPAISFVDYPGISPESLLDVLTDDELMKDWNSFKMTNVVLNRNGGNDHVTQPDVDGHHDHANGSPPNLYLKNISNPTYIYRKMSRPFLGAEDMVIKSAGENFNLDGQQVHANCFRALEGYSNQLVPINEERKRSYRMMLCYAVTELRDPESGKVLGSRYFTYNDETFTRPLPEAGISFMSRVVLTVFKKIHRTAVKHQNSPNSEKTKHHRNFWLTGAVRDFDQSLIKDLQTISFTEVSKVEAEYQACLGSGAEDLMVPGKLTQFDHLLNNFTEIAGVLSQQIMNSDESVLIRDLEEWPSGDYSDKYGSY